MDSLLERGKEAFEEWRAKRKRQGRVNTALKKMALDLLERYPLLTVSDAIGVKASTLSGWKEKIRQQEEKAAPAQFISLSPCEISETKSLNSDATPLFWCPLKLRLPGELELTLPEQEMGSLIPFLRALSKEFCL